MSKENVEIVRAAFDAWERWDVRALFEELFDPDVRLDLSAAVFNPNVYDGYDGMMRWRTAVDEIWEVFSVEAEEFHDGRDGVVVFVHERGLGKASGIKVDRASTFLLGLRAGRVSLIRGYADRQQAFRDAGLPE
jgi:ketosteroid isomerase-like protein